MRGLAATAALIVALAGCGGAPAPTPAATPAATAPSPSGPAPSESASAAVPPAVATDGSQATLVDTPFASARYGYRLVVPKGWTINEVPGSGGLHPDEPGVDTFRDREGHILSVLGEPATDLVAWTSPVDLHLRQEHALKVEARETLTVAGVPATMKAYHLPIPPSYLIHYLDTALVHDGLGLVLSLESTTRDDAGDRAVLDGFLETLEVGAP